MKKTLLIEIADGQMALGIQLPSKKAPQEYQIFKAATADGEKLDFSAPTKILMNYVQEHGCHRAKVKIAVRTSRAVVRIARVPAIKPKDFHEFVLAQTQDLLPIDLKGYVCDYRILRRTKEKADILLAALPIDLSEAYSEWLEGCGLEPLTLDLSCNVISLYLAQYYKEPLLLIIEYATKIGLMLLSEEYEYIEICATERSEGVTELSQAVMFIRHRFEKVVLLTELDWIREFFNAYTIDSIQEDSVLKGLTLVK